MLFALCCAYSVMVGCDPDRGNQKTKGVRGYRTIDKTDLGNLLALAGLLLALWNHFHKDEK